MCCGDGIGYGEEVVTVQIPAGVAEGMQLSMSGKGNAGKHNGVPGDLLILVEEEPHPDLIRDENDLIYNLLLSFPTAALGGAVEIPTIDGKVKVKIAEREWIRNRGFARECQYLCAGSSQQGGKECA